MIHNACGCWEKISVAMQEKHGMRFSRACEALVLEEACYVRYQVPLETLEGKKPKGSQPSCIIMKHCPFCGDELHKETPVAESEWWKPLYHQEGDYWGFLLPNGTVLTGFENEAATRSALARMQEMWPALVYPPGELYEVFLTDGEGWGFFDRSGLLHASFPSAQEAQELATKRKEGAS